MPNEENNTPILKHKLNSDEQAGSSYNHKSSTIPGSKQLWSKEFNTVNPDNKSNKIGSHHHDNVQYTAKSTNVSIP